MLCRRITRSHTHTHIEHIPGPGLYPAAAASASACGPFRQLPKLTWPLIEGALRRVASAKGRGKVNGCGCGRGYGCCCGCASETRDALLSLSIEAAAKSPPRVELSPQMMMGNCLWQALRPARLTCA